MAFHKQCEKAHQNFWKLAVSLLSSTFTNSIGGVVFRHTVYKITECRPIRFVREMIILQCYRYRIILLSKTWKFSVYFKFHEIPCKICGIRQKPRKICFSTLCSHSFRDFTVKIFFLGISKNWDKIKIWYVLRTLHRTKYVVL